MSDQSLVLFDPQAAAVPPVTLERIDALTGQLRDAVLEGAIPCDALGESIAQEDVQILSQAAGFLADYERAAKVWREPYYEEFKRRKALTDTAILPFAKAYGDLQTQVADHAKEKRQIEERINRQRQEEAARKEREEREKQEAAERERQRIEQEERNRLAIIERERLRAEKEERERLAAIQRQIESEKNAKLRAELEARAAAERKEQEKAQSERAAAIQRELEDQRRLDASRAAQRQDEEQRLAAVARPAEVFEAPRTEGVREKISWEFDIEDPLAFVGWCIKCKPHWINQGRLRESFFMREITEALNTDGANVGQPLGLRVYRALGVTVKKPKRQPTLNIATSRVEL